MHHGQTSKTTDKFQIPEQSGRLGGYVLLWNFEIGKLKFYATYDAKLVKILLFFCKKNMFFEKIS